MFRKIDRKVGDATVVVEEPVLVRPKPVLEWVVAESSIIENYSKLADKLGFQPVELVREKLLAFLKENEIGIFDYQKVCEWLTLKRKEEGKESWGWRPLRERDKTSFSWRREYIGGTWKSLDDHYHEDHCPPYRKLVPQHALELVEKIEKRFGDQVCFFVSDYPVVVPDPFLMVRPREMDEGDNKDYNFVIAVWDEPGFEG